MNKICVSDSITFIYKSTARGVSNTIVFQTLKSNPTFRRVPNKLDYESIDVNRMRTRVIGN